MKKYIFFCGIIVLLVLNVACVNGTKMDVISFPVNATETVYCLDKDTLYDTDVYLTFNKEDNGTVVISSLITSIEYYMKGKLKIKNYKRFATSKFPDTTEFLCCLKESMAKDGNGEVEFMNSDKENFSKNRTLGHHSKMPNVIVGTILTVVITPLN